MNYSESPSFVRDYQALKTGRAVVELTGWSSISVTGADRQTFLNNFCTNDVKRLVPGVCCESFFTNVKGKIVGHGVLHCRDTEIVFVGVPGQASRLVEHLDRYIIREDVTLRDTTKERSYLLVAGESARENSYIAISWNIIGRSDSKLYEVDARELLDVVRGLVETEFEVAGQEAFEAARIEAGLPCYGVDFNEENLPQEVGRDREAISFTKGCYLGQETVARIDALGHVNQRLVGLRFFGSNLPAVGMEITRDGRVVGSVTSAVYSPKLDAPLALGMVRREANSPGTRLDSAMGECEAVSLPVPHQPDA
jgi:folate-binding protein YgfZ